MPDPASYENLVAAVKGFEGYAPRATWDYKQYSSGYGTRAGAAGEPIDRETAEARLRQELARAAATVDQFAPGLPQGTRAALTSLTFNAGPGWTNSGLGQKIKAGDFDGARQAFLQYNKAGGEVNPGLASRRAAEASWWGGGAPSPAGAQTAGASPSPAPLSIAPGGAPAATAEAPSIDPGILTALQAIATNANQQAPAPQPMTIQFPSPPGLARARLLARAMASRAVA